ncbi:MAG: Ig-like domain-containing protein, partial [Gemmatimonadaceae bacterium]
MRIAASIALILVGAAPLHAQSTTLEVLRHTPSDTATPGNVITVTFDRPVAGRLGATVDAAHIFHVSPNIPGRVEWRDPVTIRFVPNDPLVPGTRVIVTVDTTFRAFDGSRLAHPYDFAFRVPGPRILARSFLTGYLPATSDLPLDGRIELLYSAPVDLARLQSRVRIELSSQCTGGARHVPLRVVRQRAITQHDRWEFRFAGGWDRDTTADRFRRVVELEPEQPIPFDCSGFVVLPNTEEDLSYGAEERFAIETAPSFRLRQFDCSGGADCAMDNLYLRFSAAVKRSDILRHVHLVPAIPLVLNAQSSPSAEWRVNITLAPRTTYAVVVDSTLQDVHGRTLQGPRRARVVTGDYAPSIDYVYGALTIPRTGTRTLTVHYVNVRTIRVVSYRIPLSARTRVLAVGPSLLDRAIGALPGLRPETTLVRLDGRFNVPDTTSFLLPHRIAPSDSTLVALRMEIEDRITEPNAKALMQGTLPPITIYGQRMKEGVRTTRYALLQATDIAV